MCLLLNWRHIHFICVYQFSERTFIYNGPQNQEVDASTDVVFACEAITDCREISQLTITWTHNGEEIDFENEPSFQFNIRDNTLTILASEEEDSGDYTCVAHNGLDSHDVTAGLSVNGEGK